MATPSQVSSSGGIGFGGLLLLTFIILKLCGVIAWSWWWVLSPLWMPILIVVVVWAVILGLIIVSNKGY